MNIAIAQLKSAINNPSSAPEKRGSAISGLREIAADPKDARATDAALILRELNLGTLPVSTGAGQTTQAEPASGLSEAADDELLEALTKYPVGGTPDDPRSHEAQMYYDDLLASIYAEQDWPRILANCKLIYQSSRHELIREKAFWALAGMAFSCDWPRGQKTAEAFVQRERPNYTANDFINSPYRPHR